VDQLITFAKAVRITQWVKNVVVFAPIVFSGFLFVPGAVEKVVWTFVLFCGLSSSVYLLNDILDIQQDKAHPFKKNRPIASGKMSIVEAIMLLAVLASVSLMLGYFSSSYLFIAMLGYLILNIVYSLWLKNIPILDVFAIATGFVIRVYAGSFVINVYMDVWFLLTVVSASLFLAVGKRRSEMTLLSGANGKVALARQSLTHYTPELLGAYASMFANTTWLTYALFSFLRPPFKPEGKFLRVFELLPQTFLPEKWLMATVPLVIYGVMRYMQLIFEKNQGESPHRVLMSDGALITTVCVWGLLVVAIIYVL